MRVSDRAVQNTPLVYYTVGIKDPAASFFNRSCCRALLYPEFQSVTPYDGDRRPEAIIFSEPVVGETGGLSGCMLTPEG
jgi:hypothetical protein